LNAEVFTGTQKNTECVTYCEKVINAGYSLESNYDYLFRADNNLCDGIIFPIAYDGNYSKTWGGTTYIINAATGGGMNSSSVGISGGWAGNTTTSALVNKFPDETGDIDARAMFFTSEQSLEIGDYNNDFTQGYAITKWKNLTRDGVQGADGTHVDTDFPMFRLADVYLMYAEANLRGGGGSTSTAVDYINQLRERAYGDATGNITSSNLTLDFILDERARELYWEGYRRTDLIRFGKFSTSNYVWPWKGGSENGISTDVKYNLFPIPSSDLSANPNLTQNPGY
jgi:hypothetical protein